MPHHDLRPGDRVSFTIGRTTIHARVIEDRGHLGVGGRQIVRVEVIEPAAQAEDARQFEMPADDLSLEQSAA